MFTGLPITGSDIISGDNFFVIDYDGTKLNAGNTAVSTESTITDQLIFNIQSNCNRTSTNTYNCYWLNTLGGISS